MSLGAVETERMIAKICCAGTISSSQAVRMRIGQVTEVNDIDCPRPFNRA